MIYGHRELGQRLLSLLPAHIPEALGGRAQGMAHTARLMACFTADLSRALQHAREALVAFRRVGAIRDVLGLLTNTACLLVELGAFEEAASMLEEAVELAERLASKARVYGALQNLGYLCLQSGQLERGVEVLTEVVPFYASVGLPRDEATSLAYLALLHGRRGALELAKATSVRSVQLASEPEVEALVLAVAASIDLLCGSPYDALHSAQRAFDLLQEYQLPEHLALTRVARAESLLACGRTDEAREAIAEAHAWLLSRASRIEDPHDRESLLTRVPENARIVQLAAQWLSASA